MIGAIDEDLGRRLLDGPLRMIPDLVVTVGDRDGFSPSQALSTYFHDRPRQFSGSLFDSFGGGGDRPDVENQITREDVMAVAAINAAMPPAVVSRLLSEPASGRLGAALRQLPTDVDLWDADDATLMVATEAWEQIRAVYREVAAPVDGWMAANKLLGRKRPRLIPLYDAKVRRAVDLAEGSSWWRSLRAALRRDGEDNEIRFRVCWAMVDAGVGYVSVIRGLDVILWTYATSSQRHGDVVV